MLKPDDLLSALARNGVAMLTGVPDSLMRPFLADVQRRMPADRHLIAANEGAAVALAIGHHLRTGEVPLVYLQNSGLGNAINPLLSLASPEVYGIPMLLLIGWRGEPGRSDEPQHVTQGRVMTSMLDAMGIPWSVLPDDPSAVGAVVGQATRAARSGMTPFALLVRTGTFDPSSDPGTHEGDPTRGHLPTREEALQAVVATSSVSTVLVATTGMLGRELFELRVETGAAADRDFLTVGGMGHATSIALGIARAAPDDEVWVLDGDGALLMHLGVLPVVASSRPRRFLHVLFDNGVHDSVGGQPTPLDAADPVALALAAGYPAAARAESVDSIATTITGLRDRGGPALLHLPVRPGHRPELGRPTRTPAEGRAAFRAALGGTA